MSFMRENTGAAWQVAQDATIRQEVAAARLPTHTPDGRTIRRHRSSHGGWIFYLGGRLVTLSEIHEALRAA